MERFSRAEKAQALDSTRAETDGWSRVIASLSTDQRIGLHMLGMQRTWGTVSGIFEAWASVLERRQAPDVNSVSHTAPTNRAPPEPDFSPRHLAPGLIQQSQPRNTATDMHPHRSLTTADLEQSPHTKAAEGPAELQSTAPALSPPVPQPRDARSVYSTSPHASTATSPVIPAVVMSNFPRQQVTLSVSPLSLSHSHPPPLSCTASASPTCLDTL